MVKFCDNPLYNYMIDKHLIKLLEYKINLNEYFDSSLAHFEIQWETYPGLHHDNAYIVKAFNKDSLRELKNAYETVFGKDLRDKSADHEVLYPISYQIVNIPITLTEKG